MARICSRDEVTVAAATIEQLRVASRFDDLTINDDKNAIRMLHG